ncbi:MAG TPA: (deoxy)nucleoside triphosphate pyrophosphohydrolase [Pseudonocardia sp.]|nr:(deoxy)nucleoside triphosphate pyrophosphohydrolase [Pseudonocardia sp.]
MTASEGESALGPPSGGAGVVVGSARGVVVGSARGVVVGAAIVRGGAVLAARRSRPPELAGRWELPGGQVEPGETEPAALARECLEELGARVNVLHRLGPDLPLGSSRLLRVYLCVVAPGSAEPGAHEHSELRWVFPAELGALDWLDADRALLPDLAAALV